MPATTADQEYWQWVHSLVTSLRVIVDGVERPDLAAADTEVDVLLTWTDSCLESCDRIVSLIRDDLLEQDQIESGDVVCDGDGTVVATAYTRYP